MYFKQLELSGFKSFADRTTLRLERGITAVVGPNGCGKSNILDSLRWVLGEQRARELRGSHMQDVIFNGSEDRHPVGMAEVSVTFDNADSQLPIDFAEVEVTRRIYRSGESEYLINKAPCRLRDIQELFMDTGIGTQAYSLVGQGKMDLILSSKPGDRRYLFEEAAGIIKYKTRKRLAVRRLESAEQNLLRLGDIVAEVQRQMRSLKRQVNAAIRYRDFTEQLRDLDIRAAWFEHTRLSEEIKRLRSQFTTAQDAFEKVSTGISKLEARREELGLTQLETDRVLVVRREGVHEIDTEMERIEREVALLRQQAAFSKDQQAQASRERDEFQQRSVNIREQIQKSDDRVSAVGEEVAACLAALEQKDAAHIEARRLVEEADTHLETMRGRAAERITSRTRTQAEVETLGANIDAAEEQLGEVCQTLETVSQQREEVAGKLAATQHEESEKQAALTETEDSRRRIDEEHAAKVNESRSLEEQWQALCVKRSSVEGRLNSLRELRDNYEGFAAGVRAVMLAKAEGAAEVEGVLGPVGDLLSTQKEYERAIEAALGGAINNVVVEVADAAKSAIDFLKARKAGRVTFLPLDLVRGSRSSGTGSLEGQPGVIGPALGFVHYEPQLQNVVEYLLRNTLVVETLDDAIRIARERSNYPRLVTLEGEVVSSAGAVTGGRMRHESRGLLGRSAEITELEGQMTEIEEELGRHNETRAALAQTVRELAQRLATLQEQGAALRTELNELGVAMARRHAELENLARMSENLDRQRNALSSQREQLEEKRRDALGRVEVFDHDDEAFQRDLAETQETASHAREALSVCARELADLRVQQATLTQRADEAERDKERYQREHEAALSEVARREQLTAELEHQQASTEEKAALVIERSRALSESKEEARAKVVEAENQQHAILEESEQVDGQLRTSREEARETQSTVHQLELELRENESQVGFFQERIVTEYGVALASLQAADVGTDEHDDDERNRLVAQIRDRLQRMGEVNLMAIEEFEALEERNEFLVTQSGDLQEAREALLGVIERSDKKIRDMFMETFTKVEENFHHFFRRLFNGGQARIYLIDEDDPLESGIEIEARPPGKKLQTISLLSGGESALTAIALLFSIFKAKPSPFCILDEVDAPLDDANIGRFLSLLDEFSTESQFVIITHNKQSMARAQVLYGVTMQERGVSQLVSVKFDETDATDSAA